MWLYLWLCFANLLPLMSHIDGGVLNCIRALLSLVYVVPAHRFRIWLSIRQRLMLLLVLALSLSVVDIGLRPCVRKLIYLVTLLRRRSFVALRVESLRSGISLLTTIESFVCLHWSTESVVLHLLSSYWRHIRWLGLLVGDGWPCKVLLDAWVFNNLDHGIRRSLIHLPVKLDWVRWCSARLIADSLLLATTSIRALFHRVELVAGSEVLDAVGVLARGWSHSILRRNYPMGSFYWVRLERRPGWGFVTEAVIDWNLVVSNVLLDWWVRSQSWDKSMAGISLMHVSLWLRILCLPIRCCGFLCNSLVCRRWVRCQVLVLLVGLEHRLRSELGLWYLA